MKPQETIEEVETIITINNGLFGELENCTGVYESIIHPPEGGTIIKPIGNTFLFKGDPDQHRVNGMLLAKSMISNIPRVFITQSWVMRLAVVAMFIFTRRTLLNLAHYYIQEIMRKCVTFLTIPYAHYNKFEKEVMRAAFAAVANEYKLTERQQLFSPEILINADWQESKKLPYLGAIVIIKFVSFICVFLANDAAYRFRVQDWFGLINIQSVVRNVRKEFMRTVHIVLLRDHAVGYKMKFVVNAANLLLRISPRARRIATGFLLEINLEQVVLDRDDWYYCLRRPSYDFRGWSIEDRLAECKRLDAENKHYYPEIRYEQPK